MGYIDNRSLTVEAILTKKGRELLSQGRQFFNITKFALSDDEIDYHLWNTSHPSGSNYYGYAIEQLPVLEPTPDESQTMRYKLVCLARDTVKIPVISVFPTNIIFAEGEEVIITPNTVQGGSTGGSAQTVNLNSNLGYTAILHNSDVGYLTVIDAAPGAGDAINETEVALTQYQQLIAQMPAQFRSTWEKIIANLTRVQQGMATQLGLQGIGTGVFLSDAMAERSVFAKGLKFKLTAKGLSKRTVSLSSTITIIGNETGGSATISVTNENR